MVSFIMVLAFDMTKNDNLAVYWEQDSAGNQQQSSTYCADDTINNVVLAFLYIFNGTGGQQVIDFANVSAMLLSATNGTMMFSSSKMFIHGITNRGLPGQGKDPLSLVGATGQVGFSSDSVAQCFADKIWNEFLGGSSSTWPFGSAVLDGVDLDIESGSPVHYAAFVIKVKSHASSASNTYYATAAPQCPFPANIGAALNAAPFDAVYTMRITDNNYSSISLADDWARSGSANPDIKVYIGAAANSKSAGEGYVGISTLKEYARSAQDTYDSFEGLMLWDASEAYKYYDKAIKSAMTANAAISRLLDTKISNQARARAPAEHPRRVEMPRLD
ncbi:hypothetical protein EW146_g3843 [Bondarzewia mesenterica]|uniref:chitinase n=1 Tax=Bondarzewia mesenterica TaxID=1095465 RepID=A0A4S4LWJ0_9AGAM|nr:hypothetical protein EW146_g3843 [Bondarzewia mesenterica]